MIKMIANHLAVKKFSLIASVLLVFIFVECLHVSAGSTEAPIFFLKIAKSIPRMGRSEPKFYNENLNGETEGSREMNALSKMFKRKIGSFSDNTYKHFPLTIEGPPELWRTLAGYSNNDELYYQTSNDFNQESWLRDKRTNDPESA